MELFSSCVRNKLKLPNESQNPLKLLSEIMRPSELTPCDIIVATMTKKSSNIIPTPLSSIEMRLEKKLTK